MNVPVSSPNSAGRKQPISQCPTNPAALPHPGNGTCVIIF